MYDVNRENYFWIDCGTRECEGCSASNKTVLRKL